MRKAGSIPLCAPAMKHALLAVLLALCCLVSPTIPAHAEEALHPMYRHSGLPVPRFVSLKSDEINVRVGPGKEYPVRWVYRQSRYPVKVVEEFGLWRRIEDHKGDGGWVYHSLLSGLRTAYILSNQAVPLRVSQSQAGRIVAQAKPGVIGVVEECSERACLLNISDVSGWVERSKLWGTMLK